MKICFVGPAVSAHIKKWSKWFHERGHEVCVISFTDGDVPDAAVYDLSSGLSGKESDLAKIRYLFYGGRIRKLVEELRPDIVNVHYATSYGTAAALSGMKGYILSIWGSDVYEFPNKSPVHRAMLRYSLRRAETLFSTSRVMAEEAKKYTSKDAFITPFGVDTEEFCPQKRTRPASDGEFVIGTGKALKPNYGIDCLLKAAAILVREEPELPLRVRIAGTGPKAEEYRALADDLGLTDTVTWLGFISQERAAEEWANMDVAVIPSSHESFGVSAVEAQASGVAAVISDAPGLLEATKPGETSLVVPRGDERELAAAIRKLWREPELRSRMGCAGRQWVCERYELNDCFERIEDLYKTICAGGGRHPGKTGG